MVRDEASAARAFGGCGGSPLPTPTIREFGECRHATQVEVVTAQGERIHAALLDGSLDLGLVNYLEGGEPLPGFETTELVRGRPVGVRGPTVSPRRRSRCGSPTSGARRWSRCGPATSCTPDRLWAGPA